LFVHVPFHLQLLAISLELLARALQVCHVPREHCRLSDEPVGGDNKGARQRAEQLALLRSATRENQVAIHHLNFERAIWIKELSEQLELLTKRFYLCRIF
jgi:hypothetical protein